MGQLIFTVLRHANAVPAVDTSHEADMSRSLSDRGQFQASERRKALGEPRYDIRFSSPALRAMQTARIVSGDPYNPIEKVAELCWTPGTAFDATLAKLFKELSYAPLAIYRTKAGALLDDQAKEAWDVISKYMGRFRAGRDLSILIVGHAVMISALGCAIAANTITENTLPNVSVGECEGFTISAVNDCFVSLTLHH